MSGHPFCRFGRSRGARLTLLCFAHAGGGCARFRRWPAAFDGRVEVLAANLRGRESRFVEEPWDDLHRIAADVVGHLVEELKLPVALAGISFGGLLAFEVAGLLREHGCPPRALFVASQPAPRAPGPRPQWHALDDAALADRLVEIGGLQPCDAASQEFRDVFLRTIRADLRAAEVYQPPTRDPLSCPLFVYHGLKDPAVTAADVEYWCAETLNTVTMRSLDAGHFLLTETNDLWLASLWEDLASIASSMPTSPMEANSRALCP
ncbi:thioesterase II family protein [Bradyrhizobium sp. CB1015]|uniref:thioesterase II family protein n=1 Tax=Bradyrhizobium sp. CB1015 TaxID=2976822 RepID=UPI0021AADAE8|nr:alpha/beta fold hydrolase [Bradyrhizobium sp. CB1015]UWU92924.1 alpha/beta fold hydrolase [Bradyrhizobium sp. CB1015]